MIKLQIDAEHDDKPVYCNGGCCCQFTKSNIFKFQITTFCVLEVHVVCARYQEKSKRLHIVINTWQTFTFC